MLCMMRTNAYTFAAVDTALFNNLCLSVAHADCFRGAPFYAGYAPAAGVLIKRYGVKILWHC